MDTTGKPPDRGPAAEQAAPGRRTSSEIPLEEVYGPEDLAGWEPAGSYDLVTCCFLHSPVDFPRTVVLRRAAGAVAAGGHLLVVGHAEPPPWARGDHHGDHDFPAPADELAALELDGGWETLVSEVRARQATGPDGSEATCRDTVTLLRRRPA